MVVISGFFLPPVQLYGTEKKVAEGFPLQQAGFVLLTGSVGGQTTPSNCVARDVLKVQWMFCWDSLRRIWHFLACRFSEHLIFVA